MFVLQELGKLYKNWTNQKSKLVFVKTTTVQHPLMINMCVCERVVFRYCFTKKVSRELPWALKVFRNQVNEKMNLKMRLNIHV